MFTLAISYLTMSNFPWFMDLTFQVPMQYCSLFVLFCFLQYCSLQHLTLLSPPDTSTTECRFRFGLISSFFVEQFLCSSPEAYWTLIDLGGTHLPVSYLFASSHWSWDSGGKDTGVVCHSLLQWTTFCQNSPPWHICLEWPSTTWF